MQSEVVRHSAGSMPDTYRQHAIGFSTTNERREKMMTNDELKKVIESNVETGIDQRGEYQDDPYFTAADAYSQNAADTVLESGGTRKQAGEASIAVWEKITKGMIAIGFSTTVCKGRAK